MVEDASPTQLYLAGGVHSIHAWRVPHCNLQVARKDLKNIFLMKVNGIHIVFSISTQQQHVGQLPYLVHIFADR